MGVIGSGKSALGCIDAVGSAFFKDARLSRSKSSRMNVFSKKQSRRTWLNIQESLVNPMVQSLFERPGNSIKPRMQIYESRPHFFSVFYHELGGLEPPPF